MEILIIDDDRAVRASLSLLLTRKGYLVNSLHDGEEAVSYISLHPVGLVLLDMNFSLETSGNEGLAVLRQLKLARPALPVILMTGWGSIPLAVAAMKDGATDFICKPWSNASLLDTIEKVLRVYDHSSLNGMNELHSRSSTNLHHQEIIGKEKSIVDILAKVAKIANTEAPVLILGETGTGKELIAEFVHRSSDRREKPFVKVNMGAIPNQLFESEMFGHKKGSFTDAKSDRVGRFAFADGGTIFLDEIGDMELSSQVKLLRVLQDKSYVILGENKTRHVDVRIICATNRNLLKMIEDNAFRQDLYYRINLVQITLPPLRERPGDIAELALYFLQVFGEKYKTETLVFEADTLSWLTHLRFPGNIRELRNLIEKSVIFRDSSVIKISDIKRHLEQEMSESHTEFEYHSIVHTSERRAIISCLSRNKNNLTHAARELGMSRGTLYRKLIKYGIENES